MKLTEIDINVLRDLLDICWKALYSFVCLAGFIAVLIVLIYFCFHSGGDSLTITLSAIEGVLAGTLFIVVKHYFPLDG